MEDASSRAIIWGGPFDPDCLQSYDMNVAAAQQSTEHFSFFVVSQKKSLNLCAPCSPARM
jgi:hypothetical protein